MESIPEGRATERSASSAGAWLRAARQQRGLHIAALAVMLKVPQAKLEALEADRFDDLPDATFTRALATAVCRALKVDPAPVLALLPRGHERELDVRPGLNQPFRERGAGPADGGPLALLGRPVVWGAALLLLAAAAIYWLPAGWLPEPGRAATAPAEPVASGIVAASAPEPVFVAEPPASAPAVVVAAPASAPLPVASAPLQVREVAPPPAVVAQPAPTLAVQTGPALRITASADSWVEVVDAKGQVLLSRVLRPGELQEFVGAAPYRLRVGNVGGTQVEWRGAAVNLAERAKDNVARLELN
ncbi:MAG: helix-turn-helix domain-containing protein [Burkholderiales bacterium]|nr:MAG: helix-turn-helix domain-containing protein [Burkholderiales bacterium]